MIFFLQPLFQEDHHKHGHHDEVQPFGAEMNQGAEDTAQRRPEKPVKMIQQRHKKHKPSPIHILRRLSRVVNRKCLVTHAENQIYFFPSQAPEPVQHGNPVKQMAGVDHQRHSQSLQRIECSQQHIDRYKFHGARKDHQAHNHGIPEGESRYIHVNSIGHSQEPESGKDWYRMGECRPKGFSDPLRSCLHCFIVPSLL